MKTSLKIFAAVLVVTTFFIFFGVHLLFTSSNPYLTGAFCAVAPSAVIYTFWCLSEKIDQLEKRLDALEQSSREIPDRL